MPKVYGVHHIALNPGVQAEEFERFVAEEVYPAFPQLHLLKGDRGDREGRYLVFIEFASVEERNRAYPERGIPSAEFEEQLMQLAPIQEKWSSYASGPADPVETDYVVVGR